MKYKFLLREDDFLVHQLFIVSTSKPAIWRRRRNWGMIVLIFLLMAWLFGMDNNIMVRNYFIAVAVISLFFYPLYSRWRYKYHYKKQLGEHLSNSYDKEVSVEFQSEYILTLDQFNSESKINYAQIQAINELPKHFLIRLQSGQSLILPKYGINELDMLRTELSDLAAKRDLNITDNTKWKWR